MKLTKIILATALCAITGLAIAAPQPVNPYFQAQRERLMAFQNNNPVQLFFQGGLGFAGNYSNTDYYYTDTPAPGQYGGAASATAGLMLNLGNGIFLGPTASYMASTTSVTFGQFGGRYNDFSLESRTTVPHYQFGVLGGVRFALQWMTYMTMGYATNGQQEVKLTIRDQKKSDVNLTLNQIYLGFGGRYYFTPSLYLGMDYTLYNIFNTENYQFQYFDKDTNSTFHQDINTNVGVFKLTFGVNI